MTAVGATVRSLAPVWDRHARVLILGSMPGEESLRRQRYYAHPRNGFWPLMEALLGIAATQDYDARVAGLRTRRVALWDVLASCERCGSLDSDIRRDSEQPNPIAELLTGLDAPRAIVLNGRKAQASFERFVSASVQAHWPTLQILVMPSTSPAHAALSLLDKQAVWSRMLIHLDPSPMETVAMAQKRKAATKPASNKNKKKVAAPKAAAGKKKTGVGATHSASKKTTARKVKKTVARATPKAAAAARKPAAKKAVAKKPVRKATKPAAKKATKQKAAAKPARKPAVKKATRKVVKKAAARKSAPRKAAAPAKASTQVLKPSAKPAGKVVAASPAKTRSAAAPRTAPAAVARPKPAPAPKPVPTQQTSLFDASTDDLAEKPTLFKQPLRKPEPWHFGGKQHSAHGRDHGIKAQPDAERLAGKSRKVH